MIRLLLKRGLNYTKVVFWILQHNLKDRKLVSLGIVLFSISYIVFQWAGLLLLYWYALQLQTDGGLFLPQLDVVWAARSSTTLLMAVVLTLTLTLIASSLALYFAGNLALGILDQGYQRALSNIPTWVLRLPDPRAPDASQLASEFGLFGCLGGARCSIMVGALFVRAIPPLIGALGAAGFVAWLEPGLTAALLVAAILWSVMLYPVTLRGLSFALQSEKAIQKYRQEVQELYQPSQSNRGVSAETVHNVARSHIGRRRVRYEIRLVIQIGATVVVAIATYYIASQFLSGGKDWTNFIVYIAALRLVLLGGSSAVAAFAAVSRFYPDVARYVLFMKDIVNLERTPLGVVRQGDRVFLGALPNGQDVIVHGGDRVAVITANNPQGVELAFLKAKLAESNLPVRAAWPKRGNGQIPADVGLLLVKSRDKNAPGERAYHGRVVMNVYDADQFNNHSCQQYLFPQLREVGLAFVHDEKIQNFVRPGSPEVEQCLHSLRNHKHRDRSRAGDDVVEDEEF